MQLQSENKVENAYSDLYYPVLLFDGECNYCNSMVNFIIKKDKKKKIRFASLQSKAAKEILKNYTLPVKTDSVILVFKNKAYLQSTAVFHVAYHLGFPYSLLFAFIIIPSFIPDFYYDLFARNRYKVLGRSKKCIIPNESIRDKFID